MTCVLGLLLNPTKWSCCCKLTVGSSGSHLSWMGPLKAIYSNSPVTRTPTAPPGTQSPIQCDLVHVISHHVPNYTFVCLSAHNPPSHQHPGHWAARLLACYWAASWDVHSFPFQLLYCSINTQWVSAKEWIHLEWMEFEINQVQLFTSSGVEFLRNMHLNICKRTQIETHFSDQEGRTLTVNDC